MPRLLKSRTTNGQGHDLKELNYRQVLFVKNLISDPEWDQTRAAKKAGYKDPDRAARRLMKDSQITTLIKDEQRLRMERLNLNADNLLSYLSRGIFTDFTKFFVMSEDGWSLKDPKSIPEHIGMLIEGGKLKIKSYVDQEGNLHNEEVSEVKLPSKTKLLEMAAKHCGIDTGQSQSQQTNVQVNVGVNGGLSGLVAQIEETRKNQVVNGRVLEEDKEQEND